MDEARIAKVLDLTYGAAAEPDLWPAALEAFADLVGADSSALIRQNQRTRAGAGLSARLDPNVLPAYFGAFARSHPSQRWRHSPRERVRHFVPHIVADDDAMPKAELMRTDFYNGFMRPFALHSIVRLGLAAEADDAAFLMVSRPQGRDRFGPDELALAARLHPHITRAFNLGETLAAGRLRGRAAEDVLAASPQALLILDGLGLVQHANPAAEALIVRRDGLSVSARRLTGTDAAATQRLHALVAAAAGLDQAPRRGGAMALMSSQRRRPLQVTVAPLRADAAISLKAEPMVLVCVGDLERHGQLSPDRLHDLFGLSPAECRVAEALFAGAAPREAAAALGVSFYTVRGHLMRIFEKTGVSGQPELMRLLAAVSAPWG